VTVAELLLAYLEHAEKHYRLPDGEPTSEIYEVKVVVRALRELYADTSVAEFGPLCEKATRQRWVNDGRSRSACNRRVAMIKRIFKWAVSEQLAPPAVYQAVATVSGLQKGRTAARECDPILPVEDAVADATPPFLNRHVRGLVEFQRLTGCRPGEACIVRRCDLDTTRSPWLYTPARHKTAHRGKARVIPVGPRAQAVLRAFFTPDITEYLFNPRRAVEERLAARAAARKTPRYPSHVARNASRRVKVRTKYLRPKYDRGSYGLAIDRACDQAFLPPGDLAKRRGETHAGWWGRMTADQRAAVKEWRTAHRWHPNQLRHAFATQVRKEHGLEAAQALLGYARADVTQVYAERDIGLALKVAGEYG
jgi:site-specific recombinase XerD